MKIGDALSLLFPNGTLDWKVFEKHEQKLPYVVKGQNADAWKLPPADPIDLFAIMGFLLSRSGAYHHVQPLSEPDEDAGVRRLIVTPDERKIWCSIGERWAKSQRLSSSAGARFATLETPDEVLSLWNQLVEFRGASIFQSMDPKEDPPTWWRLTLALFVVADEACRDVGFLADETLQKRRPLLSMLAAEFRVRAALTVKADGEGRGVYTLSAAAPDILCVLPKSRKPLIGCTVRSLSHNLALLPPRGLARARWIAPSARYDINDAIRPFNLLLIPYPYKIPTKAFHVRGISTEDSASPWGWFGVEPANSFEKGQSEISAFIENLIDAAQKDIETVHGIVLPELALSGRSYAAMVKRLEKRPGIEFVTAGLHTDQEGRKGNFTATRIIPPKPAGEKSRLWVEDIRQKHHRWRLDAAQIGTYSLGSVLDPSIGWWEKLDVLSRSLTIGVLRGETTITTLICEDLARVDPAQEVLRAIGPNIVIALLMDSAQLQTRWPNRYATVLAEDPGSSVLTVTSMGLIERVNETGFYNPSRCFALWRDDQDVKELKLPLGAQALCITLSPLRTEESTLDGRSDHRNSLSWRLSGVRPVTTKMEPPSWLS